MAKAKNDKALDAALSGAIDELLKDCRSAMREAVRFAAERARDDFMQKAKTCLQEYYDNYDPTEQYARTESLQYSFLPCFDIDDSGDKITGSVGVEYSASMLEQMIPPPVYYQGRNGERKIKHVGYYGSSKYQPVDASWVIDNYLKGIHPATNGGITPEAAVYYEILDSKSPNQKMEKYIKKYAKIFDENVLISLLAQIAKKM